MKEYTNLLSTKGIAIGKVFNYIKSKNIIQKSNVDESDIEIDRLRNAILYAKENLEKAYIKASSEANSKDAEIFKAQEMILEDESLFSQIEQIIASKKVNAEYAVNTVFKRAIKKISENKSSDCLDRTEDIRDICNQLIGVLNAGDTMDFDMYSVSDNFSDLSSIILFADELSPQDLFILDKANIGAIVLYKGNLNSHTSILIKTLNIPLLIGKKNHLSFAGKTCIADAYSGKLIINPSSETIANYENLKELKSQEEKKLKDLIDKESVTLSGIRIPLYANIADFSELKYVEEYKCDGVGLLRSELIYMNSSNKPDEDKQLEIYKKALLANRAKPITIRTLDLSPDKIPECLLPEVISFKNLRGIKYSLAERKLFITQLKALIRASYYGEISILYPQLDSVQEYEEIQQIIHEITQSFDQNNIPYGVFHQGIMIESVKAVKACHELAEKTDFLSIGTNDLIHDMFFSNVERAYAKEDISDKKEVIVSALKSIVEAGHKSNKKICVCGELGSDPEWIPILIEIGIDSLSVTATELLNVREQIRNTK